MNRTRRALPASLALLLCGSPAIADDGRWYVGAGGGVSRLTPDTEGSSFTLEEDVSSAFGAFGGREFGSRYAAELGVTRLGEAGLSDDHSIDYSVITGGVLGYVLGDVARVRRGEAAGGFLRFGLGAVDNSSDVPLATEDSISVWAGIGTDVPLGRVWALRAELASFDGDAQAATVSLLWRPRSARPRVIVSGETAPDAVTAQAPSARSAPAPAPPPVSTSVRASEPASMRTPSSALALMRTASREDCPRPAGGEPVDGRGCARFAGVVEGADFAAGTATLTARGRRALERLAAEMLAEPAVTVEIRAHVAAGTDRQAERTLSRERAIATARHLAGQGVPLPRLRARAFGNERPRTDGGADARIELGVVAP